MVPSLKRSNVLLKALVGYQRILHNVREGMVRRNRKGQDMKVKRRFSKFVGKTERNEVREDDPTELNEST